MPATKPTASEIYTISRLNREVRAVLEEVFPTIWVQGEISNLAKPASGHIYFTLIDSAAQVRCAMFKNRQSSLRFTPENGALVLARANIGLYEGRGEYQLIIESLEPAGEGALQLAFEALKKKLSVEGLFDEIHKKPLPTFPKTIGVVTSASGAAIRDIVSVLKRRYPYGEIIIYPVPVQGEGAAQKISQTIKLAEQRKESDVLILSRGGGSLEDLWAFNEEIVARAVFDCDIPLVCGVGHEIDFTIADFVADKRAATPSAAAEMVSPDSSEVINTIQQNEEKLIRKQQQLLTEYRRHIDTLKKLLPHPSQRLMQMFQRTDEYAMRLTHCIEQLFTQHKILLGNYAGRISDATPYHKVTHQQEKLKNLSFLLSSTMTRYIEKANDKTTRLKEMLKAVGPQATLERGYAIVTEGTSNAIVRNTSNLRAGDQIRIRLAKAEIDSTINKIHEK